MTDGKVTPRPVEVFATLSGYRSGEHDSFAKRLRAESVAAEEAGLTGLLIYVNKRQADPWVVAQLLLDATERLVPLIAVQPAYEHPYSVAKRVATLAAVYRRPLALNLIAGTNRSDLTSIGQDLEHGDRYGRLAEFTRILVGLLGDLNPFTAEGRHFSTVAAHLGEVADAPRSWRITFAGSSAEAIQLTATFGGARLTHLLPEHVDPDAVDVDLSPLGLHFGITARATRDAAWQDASERFPSDPVGQSEHRTKVACSDTVWHSTLEELVGSPAAPLAAAAAGDPPRSYWLGPYAAHQRPYPMLVGSTEEIRTDVGLLIDRGCRMFVLDRIEAIDEIATTVSLIRAAAPEVMA